MIFPPSSSPVGRFAPTPSGPLHFGSVVAAVGSYLDARDLGGQWLVRIDDVDAPRAVRGAGEGILRTLEALGFEWDGAPVWQHARTEQYAAALERLRRDDRVYGCACTRKMLAGAPRAADGSARYPGTCRDGLPAGAHARAWRFRVPAGAVGFEDRLQGRIEEDVSREAGDFILKRADGLFAYQLATVVDDAEAGVTDVVRGIDLMPSTPRQIAIQQALGLPTPRYAHLPVVVDAAGQKLSKQSLARAVDDFRPAPVLVDALSCLGQAPPDELARASVATVWAWARAHWSIDAVPRVAQVKSRRDYDR
ncbi:tRNA glutamyl-Q(34) synthetase GluQRS [Nitrogeniibacter mangrovi]|uniref:Glutamyl-Q tRNA(Asp) synthetase n=1 Tax=Nitrogeniibacter mangrovi TaxID=2016596 RepID=A0A6C1B832_9RHOO|nr:tRNA glutamyl-Q(34) synthetase GluQRS [Nitrogeniibacter mangrovi]QID18878.1 tRNA glutamyl-Q(34) synthetase GluQRS [Nitrogeniibacter mangrovi]